MGSYIGREPTTGHFPVDNFTSSGGSTYTLCKAPASAGAIEVSVQGILQSTTAYTVSGTTLTMAGVTSGVKIFVRHLGETLVLPTPADGSVTTAKLAPNAVTSANIAANTITDADIAASFFSTDRSWTGSQRSTLVVDNDGSFDMDLGQNFKCTPAGNFTLTFTNHSDGQSGYIILINSGGHTVSLHANSKADANLATTVSTAGTYILSYIGDGTNAYLTNSAIMA